MSATQAKTLSPTELAKLEHAFASDPTSDAYRPLAEAYLSMSRYMEAMVVCKKGVKAHPQSAAPRLMLARVYAEQGKDKKATEELAQAVELEPRNLDVLRLQGRVLLRSGDTAGGQAALATALSVAPGDAESVALLKEAGLPVPSGAPAAPAAAAPAPAPSAGPAPQGPPVLQPVSGTPVPAAAPRAPAVAPAAPAAGAPAPSLRPAPAAAPAARRNQVVSATRGAPALSAARHDDDDDDELPRGRSGGGKQKLVFVAMLALVPLAIGGYTTYRNITQKRETQVRRQLAVATEQLKHDSFESYKKVTAAAEEALEIDGNSPLAHGILAYAYTIRWTEHGGGDVARSGAERHLTWGAQNGAHGVSSHFIAARALFDMGSGKGTEALQQIRSTIEGFEAQGRSSSLLYLTRGLLEMQLGDLTAAEKSLATAHGAAPDDPRIYAAQGTLARQLGQIEPAEMKFANAMTYESNHPESLLGLALLRLNRGLDHYGKVANGLERLLTAEPPPSPRQLATASMARSLLIGTVLSELGDLSAAQRRELLKETKIPPDRAAATEEMERMEKQALSLSPNHPELYVLRGRRHERSGSTEAALADYRRAVELAPQQAYLHTTLAEALLKQPQGAAEAEKVVAAAIRALGPSPRLRMMHGKALLAAGKVDEAIVEYRAAMGGTAEGQAQNPEARAALGAALAQKRVYDEAKAHLEASITALVARPSALAAALTDLGRVYQATSELEKAEDAFSRAIKADDQYAPAYFHFARFFADASNRDRASALAKDYLRRDPRGAHASEAQALLQ